MVRVVSASIRCCWFTSNNLEALPALPVFVISVASKLSITVAANQRQRVTMAAMKAHRPSGHWVHPFKLIVISGDYLMGSKIRAFAVSFGRLWWEVHHMLTSEFDVSYMQECTQYLHHFPNLLVGEHEHFHSWSYVGELCGVVPALAGDAATLGQIIELGRILKLEFQFFLLAHSSQKTVEYVIVPFVIGLTHDPRFLQEVLIYFGAFDDAMFAEVDVYVFSKTTRVVVSYCLCVSECFWKKSWEQNIPTFMVYPLIWDWLRESAVRSTSADRWWRPSTARWVWSTRSCRRRSRHWWWCTDPVCSASCCCRHCRRWRICVAAVHRSSGRGITLFVPPYRSEGFDTGLPPPISSRYRSEDTQA